MTSSSTSTLSGSTGAKKQQNSTSIVKASSSTSSLTANKNSKSIESLNKSAKPTATTSTQINSANKPHENESRAKSALVVDDELMEFERLEEYVEEHPSFRSSTSFVESIFTSSHHNSNCSNSSKKSPNNADESATHELSKMLKELQLSNPNNAKLSYMLSLIGGNNLSTNRKLADLSEVDEKECNDVEDEEEKEQNFNENSNQYNYNGNDGKESNISSPTNEMNFDNHDYENENESSMMQRLLNKSDDNSKVVVLRKIKRIQKSGNEYF